MTHSVRRVSAVTTDMMQAMRMEALTEALHPVGWRPEPDTKRKRANHYLVGGTLDGERFTVCGLAYPAEPERPDVPQLPRTLQCEDCRANLLAYGFLPVFFTLLE